MYPFGGFAGSNILTVLYYWDATLTVQSIPGTISIRGIGFIKSYWCRFAGQNQTNNPYNTSTFATSTLNNTWLNCPTPVGFAIANGYSSSVNLTLFEANADNSTGYQVPPLSASTITYSTCFDLVKDGSETDIDCGGLCVVKCSVSKGCNINSDCNSPLTCFLNQCILNIPVDYLVVAGGGAGI